MASALLNLSLRKGRGRGERREERREEKKRRNEIGVRLALFGGPLAFHDFFVEISRDFRFCVISEVPGPLLAARGAIGFQTLLDYLTDQ